LLLTAAPVFGALYLTCWVALPGGRSDLEELHTTFGGVWRSKAVHTLVQ
jgi:hypothetical protein